MTERIYGGWDTPRAGDDPMESLWHRLAAQHVGTAAFQPNSGLSQRKNEIIELWQLFVRQKPMLVVEIGVAQGGTLAGWCQLDRQGAEFIIIDRCVDDCWPRAGDPVHPSIGKSERMTSAGGGAHALLRPSQKLTAINGWTHDPAVIRQFQDALRGRRVDWLFHDASHSKEMFQQDFANFWPHVGDGGIFAVHDIQPSAHPDVTKAEAWEEIKRTADYSAVYEYRGPRGSDSMGVGVLIR